MITRALRIDWRGLSSMSRRLSAVRSRGGVDGVATAPISRGQVEQGGGDSPLPIGSRLPSLTSSAVGGRVQWRNLRAGGTAVIFLQGVEEGDELDYITSLQALAGEYGLWDGRVIAVVPGLDHSALDELETASEEDSDRKSVV